MSAAVDDVHHRNRKHVSVGSADISVQRNLKLLCCSLCDCQGNAQNSVCAQFCLVLCSVQLDHKLVDVSLLESIHADDGWSDYLVNVPDCFKNALSAVTLRVLVAEFDSLVLAGGSSGWNGCHTLET